MVFKGFFGKDIYLYLNMILLLKLYQLFEECYAMWYYVCQLGKTYETYKT